MLDLLQQLAGVIGVTGYIFLITGIYRRGMEQSFAAFLLWGMLDTIAMITSIIEKGNFWLPTSNAIGASLVAILLVVKKGVVWTWVESLTAVMVVICLIIWVTAGDLAGLVASSVAGVIASIPQMITTYRRPQTTPINAYIIFLAADLLSFFAGKSWTVTERFYAGNDLIISLVILIFSLKKLSRPRPEL